MPKRPSLDPEAAVPIRVEVVPRRGLSRHEAARYVGVSVTKLDQMVDEGQMPEPFRIGSRVIYDLKKLDAAFDALSGPSMRSTASPTGTPRLNRRPRQFSGSRPRSSPVPQQGRWTPSAA